MLRDPTTKEKVRNRFGYALKRRYKQIPQISPKVLYQIQAVLWEFHINGIDVFNINPRELIMMEDLISRDIENFIGYKTNNNLITPRNDSEHLNILRRIRKYKQLMDVNGSIVGLDSLVSFRGSVANYVGNPKLTLGVSSAIILDYFFNTTSTEPKGKSDEQ